MAKRKKRMRKTASKGSSHIKKSVSQKSEIGTLGELFKKAVLEQGGLRVKSSTEKAQTKRGDETKKPQVTKATSRKVIGIANQNKVEIHLEQPTAVSQVNRKAKDLRSSSHTYTQFCKGEAKRGRDLVVGLDFGTSSTKIAIQDAEINTSYLIDFGDYSEFKNASYLLQTQLFYRNKEGKFSITSGDILALKLKQQLIEYPYDDFMHLDDETALTAVDVSSAYLGLVLRLARKCFAEKYGKIYSQESIDWQLNIGVPSRSYDDVELVNLYRTIGLAAWDLSVLPGLFSIDDVQRIVADTRDRLNGKVSASKESIPTDAVQPVPEIVAGVLGYTKSPMVQTDLMHLIIDVGAGTVDVCNVMLPKDKGYSFLTTEIAPLGGHQLVFNRLQVYARELEGHLKKVSSACDSISSPPSASSLSLDVAEEVLDEKFMLAFCALIGESLSAVKNDRWKRIIHQDDIPVLFTGGGSKIGNYKAALERLNVGLRSQSIPKLRLMNFNEFPGLEYSGKSFDPVRVGVTYGLSFSFDDIGDIRPPSQVESLNKDGLSKYSNPVRKTGTGYTGASWRFDH